MMPPDNLNPLLDFSGLPRFDAIRVEHVARAIETLIAEARATIARVAGDKVTPVGQGVSFSVLPIDLK